MYSNEIFADEWQNDWRNPDAWENVDFELEIDIDLSLKGIIKDLFLSIFRRKK